MSERGRREREGEKQTERKGGQNCTMLNKPNSY